MIPPSAKKNHGIFPNQLRPCINRGLFSAGNQLSEMLIKIEIAFGKWNQISIEGSPCSVKGTSPFKLAKGNFSTLSQKQ